MEWIELALELGLEKMLYIYIKYADHQQPGSSLLVKRRGRVGG
jgi:hypothetical protein